jgi:hypothetical protein
MSQQHCTCTTVVGSSYYCPIHGGNGSWAALLSACLRALQNCWDPAVARQVIAAKEKLPVGHPLVERADQMLTDACSIRN